MATERFLGSAWASVHGPHDARDLVVWVLESGFRGLCAGPAARPIDWLAVRAAVSELPSEIAALRSVGVLEPFSPSQGNLASIREGERDAAMVHLRSAISSAVRLGCTRVLVDPGFAVVPGPDGKIDIGDSDEEWTSEQAKAQLARRDACLDRALDALCRTLYEVCRASPEVELCLMPSRHVLGLGEPHGLSHVFADLPSARLSYWHDVCVVARREELLGVPQGEWLEEFGNRMSGMTLGDCAGATLYLPPGAGGVDYPLLAAYRRRSGRPIPVVIELLPGVEPGEIPGAHAFLNKYGL